MSLSSTIDWILQSFWAEPLIEDSRGNPSRRIIKRSSQKAVVQWQLYKITSVSVGVKLGSPIVKSVTLITRPRWLIVKCT